MDEYTILMNMRFITDVGPKDYVSTNTWKYNNIAYTASGLFGEKSCTFTDLSNLTRANGDSMNVGENEEFTISFWIKTILSNNDHLSYLFSDNSSNINSNTLYFDKNNYIVLYDNLSNCLKSEDISTKFIDDAWNHVLITRDINNVTSMFLNGERIGYTTDIKALIFDSVVCTIGKIDDKATFSLAYLDDIAIIKNYSYAIDPSTSTIAIPSNYFILYIDPSIESDLEGWEDEEKKFSRYDEIVDLIEDKRFHTKTVINQLQNGLVPYLITPNWKIWEHEYPKNGKAFVPINHGSVNIDISNSIKNLYNFNSRSYKYIEGNLKPLLDSHVFMPFLLFINGRMIPWSDITLIKSNKYLTLSVAKYSRRYSKYVINDIRIIILPFNVSYTEEGKLDEDSVILFSFTKEGLFKLGDGKNNTDILVGSKQPNIRTLTYRNKVFKDFYINSNMDERLVKSNVYLFSNDGLLIPNPENNDEPIYCVVTIAQSPNQLITVTCNNINYIKSFRALKLSKYSITVTPDTGYKAGKLNIDPTGVLTNNIFVSVESATVNYYTVTIIPSDHQKIIVTCNNTDYSSTFTAPYGSEWSAIVVSTDESYAPGELNTVSSGTLTSDFTISASAATMIGKELLAAILDKSIEGAYYNNEITKIGYCAFWYCASLTSIDLPKVTIIDDNAFAGCTSLTSIDLPKVTSIGSFAFEHCTSLTSIDLPNVTKIGYLAFNDCTNLTAIHFSATNKSKIEALGYYSSKWGATNATIYFDL